MAPFRRIGIILLFALLALFAAPIPPVFASGASPKLPNPGFRSIGLWNEENTTRLDIAVWYPTQRALRDVHLEGWTFRAGKDSAPVPGLYPVILLSHNAAATRLASHDLAAHLARHGFVVISPTHPKDNAGDTGDFFHAANFASRPEHLVLALERVWAVPALAAVMDRSRIGVLGVGSGAVTALQLAGAAPDLSRLSGYCTAETPLDPLCSLWAKAFHPAMQKEFAALFAAAPERFTPAIEKVAKPLVSDASLTEIAVALEKQASESALAAAPAVQDAASGTPTPDVVDPATPEKPATEPKIALAEKQPILAVGLLTPGATHLFPDAALNAVTAQVGIFAAMDDTVYASAKSGERLQSVLPQRPASRVLPDADFFDLQAPCPPAYLDTFPALCGRQTPAAQDARKIRNDFFTRFFQKSLGPPAPPPLLPQR